MPLLPESVSKAWNNRKGPVIFATVDKTGLPNIIYVSCVINFDENRIIVADNYFDKTRKNILSGCKGSILFITNDDKAFQMKGVVEYHREGKIFENMKTWNPTEHPGHAAAVLKVEAVYSGAEKLL